MSNFARRLVASSSVLNTQSIFSKSRPSLTHHGITSWRGFSSPSPDLGITPPSSLNFEMAAGIQDTCMLYLEHGVSHRRLSAIALESGESSTLVPRWQKMMEAFLGTQVHVLSGLGYSADEHGIMLYNQHLALFMQDADPETQEIIRVKSRDAWRQVLSVTFNVSLEDIREKELSIVDARNIMYKVSQKMQHPEILESVANKIASAPTSENAQVEATQKHMVVQHILVNEVYLGGDPSLVKDCGFGDGEEGYVHMQCAIAEHQSDPLVQQYIGAGMMQVLKAAGLDPSILGGKQNN